MAAIRDNEGPRVVLDTCKMAKGCSGSDKERQQRWRVVANKNEKDIMGQDKETEIEKTMFDGKELEPPPMAVAVANITKSNHNIMGLSSNAAEPWPTRLGMVGSFLGLDLLGVSHLLGDSGD